MSNITAGTRPQIQIVINHPIFIKALNAINDPHFEINKEGLTIVSNITKLGTESSVKALINAGIIKEAAEFLNRFSDANSLICLLNALLRILKMFENSYLSQIVLIMRSSNMTEAFDRLVMFKNPKIEKLVLSILKFYEFETSEFIGFS